MKAALQDIPVIRVVAEAMTVAEATVGTVDLLLVPAFQSLDLSRLHRLQEKDLHQMAEAPLKADFLLRHPNLQTPIPTLATKVTRALALQKLQRLRHQPLTQPLPLALSPVRLPLILLPL